MTERNEFEYRYAEMPLTGMLYAKALISRKPKALPESAAFPKMIGMIESHEPDLAQVELFRQTCGFEDNGELPSTYPFVMANPIMMDLFMAPEFPLKAMGLVHVRQEINQTRPIPDDVPVNIKVFTGEARRAKRGVEFDVIIEVYLKEELVWNATSTILSRADVQEQDSGKKKKASGKGAINTTGKEVEERALAKNLGRQYAKASGDYNPIHINPLMAKLFGYKSHIIHGMWTMSWVAGRIIKDRSSFNFSIMFKAPIFLPNNICLIYDASGEEVDFRVTSVTKTRDFASGRVEPVQQVKADFETPVEEDEYTPAPTTMHEQELIGH